MSETATAGAGAGRIRVFVESPGFQHFILIVIAVNAVVLGLQTSPGIVASTGTTLQLLDQIALTIFVCEILLKMSVYRLRYFRDPWNVFDLLVVGIALVPDTGGLSVLRALRILRVFRLVSMVPKMRLVVQAFLKAIPGMGSVMMLLLLVFYVFAVMATHLFGAAFSDWFGSVGRSLYSLFQIMTLESWSMGIVRPVMEKYPYAWVFFIPFIGVTTFAVLNLFVATVVNSMQEAHADEDGHGAEERAEILDEIRRLREEVTALARDRAS